MQERVYNTLGGKREREREKVYVKRMKSVKWQKNERVALITESEARRNLHTFPWISKLVGPNLTPALLA